MTNLARCNETPEGDEQLTRQRHNHRLACAGASVGGSCREPLGQGAVLLEPDKTPSQLNHAAADADIAGARKTPFASTTAALVDRASKAGVAGDGLAIAPVAREDLVDQHVRRFDTSAKDPGNQSDHPGRAFRTRGTTHPRLGQA